MTYAFERDEVECIISSLDRVNEIIVVGLVSLVRLQLAFVRCRLYPETVFHGLCDSLELIETNLDDFRLRIATFLGICCCCCGSTDSFVARSSGVAGMLIDFECNSVTGLR